jgi:SAM-dependent methyltransferase
MRHPAPTQMQSLQELGYPADRDYRNGSPHLLHWHLYDRLTSMLRRTIAEVMDAGLPPTILEIGAGHGAFTEPALAAGAQVTATDMSRPSVERLTHRYRTNPTFEAVFDPDGSLSALGGRRFSLIVCSSVLHHIPDYQAFLSGPMLDHLDRGGAFVSFQDPLWYPSVGPLTRRLSRYSFLLWRMTQGNYRQGAATIGRRLRRVYDETNPADMVEYHVVRQGVDHLAIERLMNAHFDVVELETYWSTVSSSLQRIGDRLNRPNTFALRALNRL